MGSEEMKWNSIFIIHFLFKNLIIMGGEVATEVLRRRNRNDLFYFSGTATFRFILAEPQCSALF
jgi:hypothetical protein